MTALSYSILTENIEIVKLLLFEYTARIDIKTRHKLFKNPKELVNDSNNCELKELIKNYESIEKK